MNRQNLEVADQVQVTEAGGPEAAASPVDAGSIPVGATCGKPAQPTALPDLDLPGLDLSGRTAVVTGGSRGIGRAIALALANHGANVAVIYAGNGPAAHQVVELAQAMGVSAQAYRCDVADYDVSQEVCDRIVKDFGSIDILVNNAGIIRDNLMLRMSAADFDEVIAVNLKGAFNVTHHLMRSLLRSKHGRIINISSVSGMMGNPGQANYAAAKAGLIGMTKTVAREVAGRAVTCNAIAPGLITTDMTAALSDQARSSLDALVPLKRAGQPAEIAAAALFLASDMAAYITGEVLRVDGGMYI
ncbi:MAG: 3-oxoacyl-[acyl-carrier-protein] reductase [Propionibacteriaceae bacterium]|jgi:3-oxoacyl-[acyl-carrier protein] reductase|nr:3-oxoacyl-[acyl-carrier-protein] reductase [Propionibacteriaceae bacterium]